MAEDMNKSAAETEEEYQPDLMTLEDEDGNEVTFEVIDALDHKACITWPLSNTPRTRKIWTRTPSWSS